MKKRIFIIHGWEGSPESNWFLWLKNELEKLDYAVAIPQMPGADQPRMAEWMDFMNKLVGDPDENTYLIGHSLGTISILRYLERMDDRKKIGGIILVAAFSRTLGIPEIENFLDRPVDWENIKSKAGKVVVINSDNDPYVALEEGKIIVKNLDGKLVVMENADHINAPYGKFELPAALEELIRMSK